METVSTTISAPFKDVRSAKKIVAYAEFVKNIFIRRSYTLLRLIFKIFSTSRVSATNKLHDFTLKYTVSFWRWE